jgi:hypothetical protein
MAGHHNCWIFPCLQAKLRFNFLYNINPVQRHMVQESRMKHITMVRHGWCILCIFNRKMPGLDAISRHNHTLFSMVSIGSQLQVSRKLVGANICHIANRDKGVDMLSLINPFIKSII